MATAAGAITSRIYTVTETYNTSFEVNDPKWTLSRMQRRSFRKLESQTPKTDSKKFKDTKRLQTSIAVGEQITSPIMMSRDDPGNAKLHGTLEWGKEQKLNMEESKAAARAMRNLKLCEERVVHSRGMCGKRPHISKYSKLVMSITVWAYQSAKSLSKFLWKMWT